MDIETATAFLRDAATPVVIRLEQPGAGSVEAAWRRLEAAGAEVSVDDSGSVTLELGSVTLSQRRASDVLVLEVPGDLSSPAAVRIVFRVMASLGRGAQRPVELVDGASPANVLFRYRPGGPGLAHVPSGERVAPYDEED